MSYSLLLDQAVMGSPGAPLQRVQKQLDDGLKRLATAIRGGEYAPLALVVEATEGSKKKVKKSDLLAAEWGMGGTVYHSGGDS